MKVRHWILLTLLTPALFAAQAACSSDEASTQPTATAGSGGAAGTAGDSGPSDADANSCGTGEDWYYVTSGCGAASKPKCESTHQDACIGTFCGCDGVTFTDGCGTSKTQFQHTGACEGGDADSGACTSDEMLRYISPGCGAEAKLQCVDKYQDACAAQYCGCDGVTIGGGCQSSQAPYAHTGPCEDGDSGSD